MTTHSRLRLHHTALRVGAALLLGGVLAGCGGASTISADELESSVAESLTGSNPDLADPAVSCPDDVDAEVGATTECTFTPEGGAEVPLAIEITEIEDDRFQADVNVSSIPATALEAQVRDALAEQQPDLPEPTISCPGDVDAEAGATTECTLTVEGDDTELPVSVEITGIDGGTFQTAIEVGQPSS